MYTGLPVLIVEDDPRQMAEICDGLAPLHMDLIAARSPVEAEDKIANRNAHPLIAVVDWNMSLAPDRTVSVPALLRWIRHRDPTCTVVVFTPHTDELPVTAAVQQADPSAYLHDKRHGVGSLLDRLRRMCTVQVGDLAVQGPLVVYGTARAARPGDRIPTHARFTHPIGIAFLHAHPDGLRIAPRDEARHKAARRFNAWLIAVGSGMRVQTLQRSYYRLAAAPALPAPPPPSPGAD